MNVTGLVMGLAVAQANNLPPNERIQVGIIGAVPRSPVLGLVLAESLARNEAPAAAPTAPFTLSASGATLIGASGSTAISNVTVTPAAGFSGSVVLSVSNQPPGVTCSFNPPSPSAGASILTLTAGAGVSPGTIPVTVTGTSGSLTQSTTFSLAVTPAPPAPSFSLAASPTAVTVAQGNQAASMITITPANVSGNVALTASGLPNGVTPSFSAVNPTSGTSTLTLTAGSGTSPATSTVTVTGSSGSLTQTTTFSLTVTAAASFSLAASPSTVTVAQGKQAASTITITPANVSGNVALTASGLPKGVTPSFGAVNPTTGTSTLTLRAGRRASPGTSTVTVTGTSGSLTQTTTFTLRSRRGSPYRARKP